MPEVLPPLLRRVIAVEAHRRRTGACPRLLHALGTGESFAIEPLADGFLDVESSLRVRDAEGGLRWPEGEAALVLEDDVAFSGTASGLRFSGRAGGGSSVTLYAGGDYWQYAVVT